MPEIRLATFNCENLFARFRFRSNINPSDANRRGWIAEETAFHELSLNDKALTGMAIRELDADVLALQEVEDIDTLKHFRAQSLGGRTAYPYVAGIDGNDPRRIDVAVLSRFPITGMRSNQHLLDPQSPTKELFSRDCLEVDVVLGGTTLKLFVQHFKSMMGGRQQTHGKRARQAAEVMKIVRERLGDDPGDQPFAVLGDLNDYPESNVEGDSALNDLVGWDAVENLVERLPERDQWTHFWAKQKEYRQLDYLLLSRSLAEASAGPPEIMRKGLPLRAERYEGERFVGVGDDSPKASDHCPLLMSVRVA